MQITGTAAVVTGGASGLGAAAAAALADRVAAVLALDLPAAVDAAAAANGGAGTATPQGVRFAAADVTDPDSVRAALDLLDGGPPLRIVVNCAGIGPSARIVGRRGVHDLTLFNTVIAVNLVGTFTVLALAAERMVQQPADPDGARGVVVNTASVAAFDGQVGQAAYAASKGGIVGLTLPAARDLAQYGIRVTAIAPGIVDTPMLATVSEEFRAGLAEGIPFPKRLARPDEFAQLVIDIVEHDYLNGEVIRMDGALRMAPR